MPATLKIKNSSTLASVPSGLTAGEIAVNLADKKLYIGGTGGTNIIFLDSTSSVGLGTANTFTQLNSFSAGISASGGITFASDISVNSLTVGRGGGGSIFNVAVGSSALVANTEGTDNIGVGSSALAANTEGTYNIAVGSGALTTNTLGTDNIAVGSGALTTNTEGTYNIAVGSSALASNISGNFNVAVGTSALASNGTGGNNVAVGTSALLVNTTGSNNVAVGSNALDANTTGTDNLGVGPNALGANNTGINNVGLGCDALRTNTTGTDNIGVGCSALYGNGSGGNNVALGTNALGVNSTGSNNMGIGAQALGANTTGTNNIGIGRDAGRYRGTGTDANSTGQSGIYIGYQARGSTLAQTDEIVIGVNALGLGSNTAVIGATAQSAATVYGVLNLPSGLSAAGATFNGTVNHQDNTLSRVEFLDYFERFSDLGNFTTASTQIGIDLTTAQVFRTKLTVTCTGLNVTNTPDNANANAVGFSLLFVGDGTARTMTWNIGNTAASWAGGTAPTYTTTANKIDVYSFLSRDGGSTWLGFVGGQNF